MQGKCTDVIGFQHQLAKAFSNLPKDHSEKLYHYESQFPHLKNGNGSETNVVVKSIRKGVCKTQHIV